MDRLSPHELQWVWETPVPIQRTRGSELKDLPGRRYRVHEVRGCGVGVVAELHQRFDQVVAPLAGWSRTDE
jgi:hypothetical protein